MNSDLNLINYNEKLNYHKDAENISENTKFLHNQDSYMNKSQNSRNNNYSIENLMIKPITTNIDEEKLIINRELDKAIFRYNENLDRLKLEDFLNKKKYQDELIFKINNKLNRYKKELDEKIYQENLANEWYVEYKKRMENIAMSNCNNNFEI